MAFDYKKEYPAFYLPKNQPQIVTIPSMRFVAVQGKGNPNDPDGPYQQAMSLLYGVSFTIKMSYKGSHAIDGYFSYVVPPLEGLWWIAGMDGIDYGRKDEFQWVSMIRLPDFVTKEDFDWACEEAAQKKKTDFSSAKYLTYEEGLCVQCMHIGPYDDEPATVRLMEEYAANEGYAPDFTQTRRHHEIYLSDVRRCAPDKLRTVIRHPIKPLEGTPPTATDAFLRE